MVCGALPGLVAGSHLAGLLFFLNPDVPFSSWTVTRLTGAYALLLGSISLLLSYLLFRRRPRAVRRFLPWALTAVLTASALLCWTHASHFAFYLPAGINERLIKVAVAMTILALIAFYTALLHSVHRRRYGWRSVLGFALMVLLSVFVIVERREAFQPKPPPLRTGALFADAPRPRLLLIAIESATIDAVLPLAEQGRLPFFAMLLREGARGRLQTVRPYRRATAWTSLLTGKDPHRHGIVSEELYPLPFLGAAQELRLLPAGIGFSAWGTFGVEPVAVDSTHCTSLTLPQVLSRLQVASGMLGWPHSDPVDPYLAFALSETFFRDPSEDPHRPSRHGQPESLIARAQLFHVEEGELDPVSVSRFGDPAPAEIVHALAQDDWRQSLTLYQQEHRSEVRALFVALPGLSEVSRHYYAGYADVLFNAAQDPDELRAAELLAAYYGQLDAFLQNLWQRVGDEPTILAVVSPAGMAEPTPLGALWNGLHGKPLEGTQEDAPDGLLLLHGAGIRKGAQLTTARLTDVVPTLLYALGYPIARDFDGKVLTLALDPALLAHQPLTFVPSYEPLPPPASATTSSAPTSSAITSSAKIYSPTSSATTTRNPT